MYLSQYVMIYPWAGRTGTSLVYSTRRSSLVLLADEVLTAARYGRLSSTDAHSLQRLGFVVPSLEQEREEMEQLFLRSNASRRPLHGTVVLNLDCNLACSYCYEGNFRGKSYMNEVTARRLVDLGRRYMGEGRGVSLVFYGGEPLLSRDLMEMISIPLQEAARKSTSTYSFSMVTNGTLLTRSTVAELAELGLRSAKITLDGPRSRHDASRPFSSGRGSFDVIVRNILETWDLVSLQLGGNFTRETWRDFPLLFDDLAATGITADKLSGVSFSPVSPKAGETGVADFGGECFAPYEPWLYEALLALRHATLQRGYAVPKPRLSSCMVEFDDSLVIGCDGSLYKCPAFMGYEHLRIGTLEEGQQEYGHSHGLDVWKREECLKCAYLPLCFGGCRFLTLLRRGAIDEVDCRRELLDATLETMVRQDLEYQRPKGKVN